MKSWVINDPRDPALPSGVKRMDTVSARDGAADWALVWPPEIKAPWVVMIHGHGSRGNQLYTRKDLRDGWLPAFRSFGWGLLTPNLRDNAWMGPLAAADLQALLGVVRSEYGAGPFAFMSGSMGGTSNLIYAVLHPEDVACVVALGAASDLATYHAWCRGHSGGIWNEIANAIEHAYGAPPAGAPAIYQRHSPRLQASRLTMPVFLAHGSRDTTIPVAESRKLAGALADAPEFVYVEVPEGNHNSPLGEMPRACQWAHPKLSAAQQPAGIVIK